MKINSGTTSTPQMFWKKKTTLHQTLTFKLRFIMTCMSNWNTHSWSGNETHPMPPPPAPAYNQQHTFNTSWAIFSSRGGSGCPVLSNSRFNIKDWVRHLSVNSTAVQQLLPLAVEGRVAYKTHHVWQYWSDTITSMYVFQLYQHVQRSAAQIFY